MRIFWEHFDARNNNQSYNKWTFYDVETTIQNSVKVSNESNYCALFRHVGGPRVINTTFAAAQTEFYFAFHGRWTNTSTTSSRHFLGFFTGAAFTDLWVCFDAGNMVVKTGVLGAVLATGTYTFLTDTWYHIEFHLVIHSTTGVIQTWVNGLLDIDESPVPTLPSGSAVLYFEFSNQGAGTTWYLDNLMINDTNNSDGLDNNGQIGVREMFVQFPIGDGTTGIDDEWTPFIGSTRYTNVDEPNVNADTDYFFVQTDAKRQRNTFPGTGLDENFHVFAVGFEHVARGISGVEGVKLGMNEGGTTTLTATQPLLVNYKTKVVRFQEKGSDGQPFVVATALGVDSVIESDV